MFKSNDIKSIGLAYLEVLERKHKGLIKEMDPTDHVKKNEDTGKFCVYDSEGEKVKEFDDESAANEYAKKNHDSLMKEKKMDPVDKDELKGKHSDRDDKDIDNDGDVDGSDKYLHKKRKAVSKAIDGDEKEEGYTMHKGMKVKNVARDAGKVATQANKDRRAAQRKRLGLDDDVQHEELQMIDEKNDEQYKWKDINMAMSYTGIKPATILRVLMTLNKLKSGKLNLKFKEGKCVSEKVNQTAGATPPEEIDSKDSPGAKKMRKDHEGPKHDYPGVNRQDGADKVKVAPKRPGDSSLGDKNPLKKKK